jgi:hypothetical protein
MGERRKLAAVDFGADDAAQPVARVHFSGAAIPDLIQEFHLPGVLLADIAEIQTQNGIGLHAAAAEAQQSLTETCFQFFRVQVESNPRHWAWAGCPFKPDLSRAVLAKARTISHNHSHKFTILQYP